MSIINGQSAIVQKITPPAGVNILSNSSPSLTPSVGSLALDVTTPGSLYVGNGSSWLSAPTSNVTATVGPFNMTLGGQPSFTGCTMTFSTVTAGGVNFKLFSLDIHQSQTTTGSGTWTSPSSTIPAAYQPLYPPATSYTLAYPAVVNIGGTQTNTCVLFNGSQIQLILPSSGVTGIGAIAGVYQ